MLARPVRPTAIVTLGTSALGDVLNAVAAHGLRLPADISVVSMGDPDFARGHVPAISTVSVDLDRAATEISHLLLDRMRGSAPGPERHVMVPTTFINRESCGPVPASARPATPPSTKGVPALPPAMPAPRRVRATAA